MLVDSASWFWLEVEQLPSVHSPFESFVIMTREEGVAIIEVQLPKLQRTMTHGGTSTCTVLC